MELSIITAIRPELESALASRRLGKIFQLSKFEFAIDFRLADSRYLFVSIEPGNPRIYLVKRRIRDLEKASINPTPFLLLLRKRLSGATVTSIEQIDSERVLLITLDAVDDLDQAVGYVVAVQLTGVSANIFLLDSKLAILDSARPAKAIEHQIGERYAPTRRNGDARPKIAKSEVTFPESGISETLDAEDLERSHARRFASLAASARSKLKREISKREKLRDRLKQDLTTHGDADRWKRYGDLLLASVADARRDGDKVWLTDYFDPETPEISIEADRNDSITEAAEKYFRRYTKARNAGREIEGRLATLDRELSNLNHESLRIETAIADGDEGILREYGGLSAAATGKKADRKKPAVNGARSFVSSDGFEILVGKKSIDNDFLTFRVAKSLDTWMHAADYPGSHVVIRNPNRQEIPPRTLVEAAQLAAFYSQGKAQPKAAVHYTQKKFVNKPKGSAPGLVSLASFKTLLVEPKIGDATLRTD